MANTRKAQNETKPFDPRAAHEELVALLTDIKEGQDEIIEKLQNLDLPGTDFSVFNTDQ